MKITSKDKKTEILMIFRLLSPKHQADLLASAKQAYAAENSTGKPLGFDVQTDCVSSPKPQEYSCENQLQRRKK